MNPHKSISIYMYVGTDTDNAHLHYILRTSTVIIIDSHFVKYEIKQV